MFYLALDSISLAQLLSPRFSVFLTCQIEWLNPFAVESSLCLLQVMIHFKAWMLVFCLNHPLQPCTYCSTHTGAWVGEGGTNPGYCGLLCDNSNELFLEFFIGFSKALLTLHLSLISPSAHFCFLSSFSQVLIPNKNFANYFNPQLRLKQM